MIRKASVNHSVSEIGSIVFPVTQIDDQIVIAVARVEKPGNLWITHHTTGNLLHLKCYFCIGFQSVLMDSPWQ